MPKVLENPREQILSEARKQLFEAGYLKTTIRSVAQRCGFGTGTVYNYFDSKDTLISAVLLEDWHKYTARMKELDSSDRIGFLEGVSKLLREFYEGYIFLFNDNYAQAASRGVSSNRHLQLRAVIADIILPVCRGVGGIDDAFLAAHIAEALLAWTAEAIPFEKQKTILNKLIDPSL